MNFKKTIFICAALFILFAQTAFSRFRVIKLDPCPSGGNACAVVEDVNNDGRFDWVVIIGCDLNVWWYELGVGSGETRIGRMPTGSHDWTITTSVITPTSTGYVETADILDQDNSPICTLTYVYGGIPSTDCNSNLN